MDKIGVNMNKQKLIRAAKETVNTAIKNSDLVAPYVKQSHYQKGLIALNVVHFVLRLLDKGDK